jgi:hypothetical protein
MSGGTKAAAIATMALCIGALSGCNGNPAPGSEAYKEGELGNGDFLFACDDGVACLPYSGDAKKFPSKIATGSIFDVRFVGKNQQGTVITIKDKKYDGIKTEPVAPYVSKGPDGFVAVQPGYGTLIVRDSKGIVIDYVTMHFVQPDDLIVYDANYDAAKGKQPPQIQTLNLKVDATPSYRVVAEHAAEAVAGSIPVKWESLDDTIVEVESYSRGVVNLRAKGVGKTKISAKGAALEKQMDVEVTQ